MYYVIELTCIGPQIRETFNKKELALQYVTIMSENYKNRHYTVAEVIDECCSHE